MWTKLKCYYINQIRLNMSIYPKSGSLGNLADIAFEYLLCHNMVESTGWPLMLEFLEFLKLFLDFFYTCKILELNFKPCAWFKHYAVANMLSNQCKQNSLLFYATVCHHSVLPQIRCGIVREGKEKNIFFKVGESPAVSRNLKKDQRTLSEKVRKRLMLNGKMF